MSIISVAYVMTIWLAHELLCNMPPVLM